MRSWDKLRIRLKPMYGKRWIEISIREGAPGYEEGSIILSFEDHFRILCGYAMCEIEKYKDLPRDPTILLRAFFTAAVDMAGRVARGEIDYEAAWSQLRETFKIPDRS